MNSRHFLCEFQAHVACTIIGRTLPLDPSSIMMDHIYLKPVTASSISTFKFMSFVKPSLLLDIGLIFVFSAPVSMP